MPRKPTPAEAKRYEKFKRMVNRNASRSRSARLSDERRRRQAWQAWAVVGLAVVGLAVAFYLHH